ncbi:MAG: hypothetical protein NT167_25780 [Verrucomicrobia bacterium]|nr:hypothetical protein [Verrucomicrobiota bacterium]
MLVSHGVAPSEVDGSTGDHQARSGLSISSPTSPGENTVLSACAPQKSGVRRAPQLKLLGTCPAPVQGASNITANYTGTFGVPSENQRIFFSAHIMTDGWCSSAKLFTALVPAST